MPNGTIKRPIRAPEFAERFRRACDESPHVPAKHEGRYRYVAQEFERRSKDTISIETVRKYHEGEAAPRPSKIAVLASILGVDPVWLQIGVKSVNPHVEFQHTIDGENSPFNHSRSPPLSIQVRAGVVVEVINLPVDLSASEAKRIANIIMAYAIES